MVVADEGSAASRLLVMGSFGGGVGCLSIEDDGPGSALFSFIVPATTFDATICNDDGTDRSFPAEPREATDDGDDTSDAPDGGLNED